MPPVPFPPHPPIPPLPPPPELEPLVPLLDPVTVDKTPPVIRLNPLTKQQRYSILELQIPRQLY
ncbi:hypothetical protein Pst134EA_015742 [Puccinia striiformis f. sp. tritici]|uniref:hypothetical protein n=1 Tax=Puccinia striiformis f. sp. tritici TaxID=168172 RepID=UPI002007D93B|nr:hypothetical protein Pst134EA_015742 [Puccinia striiformis f. sp. tritici]KAH9463657.1 hypothetical protein Pst134EA_015742 [Puccinia striiformis f. sp. tritici]KAI9602561.1 hypothetical protein H4Q26_001851 [Puccinia striiformis f. sp. tritici PST-130]